MGGTKLEDTRVLTTLRFFAAYHVLLLHETLDHNPNWPAWANELLERTAAVSLFFVISGLLMSLGQGNKRWVKGDWSHFMWKRMARTMPLYYIGLLLFLPLFIGRAIQYDWSVGDSFLAFLANVVHLQSWIPNMAEPWYLNRPAWTIGAFLFMYACFPFIHGALQKLSSKQIVLFGLACYVSTQLLVWFFETKIGVGGRDLELLHKLPIVRLPEFLIGVSVGCWIARRGSAPKLPVWTVSIAGVVCLGLFVGLPRVFRNYVHNGLLMPLFVLIILASCNSNARGVSFLRAKFWQRIGEASFTFYILHLTFANYLSGILIGVFSLHIRFTPIFIVVDTILLIPVTLFVYDRVEAPLKSWMLRIGPKSTR